jgi:D-alanyl-D-alanine carboxypeptidase/D-alanyl-D-alanine-endopeptidase (penicillin-binding protein 4)
MMDMQESTTETHSRDRLPLPCEGRGSGDRSEGPLLEEAQRRTVMTDSSHRAGSAAAARTADQRSRRDLLRAAAGGVVAATASAAALRTPPAAGAAPVRQALPAQITAIMQKPPYAHARWGVYVADRATGAVILDQAGGEMFIPGSVTKLFPGAAALDAYGPDERFETPVYRTGPIAGDGALQGNLVLVASADLTMGGRDTPDGRIDFRPIDHIYADAIPLATLTPEDPLAGLNDLARQVAAAGIRRVRGTVIIDDRLFPKMDKDSYILTPIWINDNLIDITLNPGAVGAPASMTWRPQTSFYQVQSDVRTVAAGEALNVMAASPRPGQILVRGELPADTAELVTVYQVEDPSAFARTLFIEALQRQTVAVDVATTGPNPAAQLPPAGSYIPDERVALHRSLPFSENLRLIFKVSHNQHADMLIMLLALKAGKTTFVDGMQQILPLIQAAGINGNAVSLGDGRGNDRADAFSLEAVTHLLRYMTTRPDFGSFFDALPVVGVDGSEIDTVPPTSPVRGQASAKSGTVVVGDLLHQRPIMLSRGLSGYLTARSGRELVFAVFAGYVPAASVLDLLPIFADQGTMLEAIYELN